ncbi:uncharacterized protein LOC141599617 [Silene latifolia]|uniref:uncharacterized protein LOC141599617 n=1 Tax=Silene latifolia TaxID=37657 RepID=UPI003D77A949
MDPNSNRLESERWLSLSTKLLTTRDFLGSKTFAIRARESDPTNNLSDQILAVAETVLAGEKRVNPSQQPDWYSVLQLPRLVRDPDLIADHYRRLVLLLSPDNNRLPFADYALQLVMDGWSVLSDPNKKWLFDNELALYLQQQPQPQQPPYTEAASNSQVNTFQFFQPTAELSMWQQQQQNQESQWQVRDTGPTVSTSVAPSQTIPRPIPARVIDGNVNIVGCSNVVVNDNTHVRYDGVVHDKNNAVDNNATVNVDNTEAVVEEEEEEEEEDGEVGGVESFWTSCPYCLYMYEYEKQYLGCSLRCQNCRRGFHGVEIPNPPPMGDRNKKSSSFCCWGFFPLGFSSAVWKKSNSRMGKSNWVPFSPMGKGPAINPMGNGPVVNEAGTSQRFPGNGGASAGAKDTGRPPVSRSRFYVDADYDDGFDSDPSDDSSDKDWRRKPGYEKKRKMNKRRTVGATGQQKVQPQDVDVQNQANPNLGTGGGVSVGEGVVQDGSGTQNVGTGLTSGAKEDARRKVTPTLTKNQARKRVKNMGKLDLNVEFNNEGDEHAHTVSAVNGEEDAIENIGFFEGLDEFFSTLPILNVGEGQKAKPS